MSSDLVATHVPMHQFLFDVFVIICCTLLSPCVCVAGPRRQFANMDYTSGSMPATGNIALELLKQTQNTKYLLGQEAPPNAHPAPPPAGAPLGLAQISEGGTYPGASQSLPGNMGAPGALKQDAQQPGYRGEKKGWNLATFVCPTALPSPVFTLCAGFLSCQVTRI